ncbi:HYR-like domain-containing protein, partial [Algibacter pacificus]|uniref:HYR-like domain-containing protein n=1 Tax=Algibacter pacificus TaxID=2599389 RepID=UPI0011CBFD60
MKRILLLILLTFSLLTNSFAQLSDLHYLPPLKQGDGGTGSILQQKLYFSTPETTPFNVSVYRGNGTLLTTISGLSNTNSQSYGLPNGNNGIALVSTANTGKVLNNAGLRIESSGGEKFYVNYRGRSSAQGTSLTSKGRVALGTLFKWGGRPNYGKGEKTLNAVLGIMATENATTVEIYGYDSGCTFRNGNDADGFPIGGATSMTIMLDAGESYVYEAPRNNGSANIDCWLGTTIKSDKKIAISNGNLNGAPLTSANNRDAGIDQPVPENVLGREYVFVRAGGTNVNETPIIIGTQNGTGIYVNGQATPIATINKGDYFVIPGSNYSTNSTGGNMYVTTSKESYAYQNIAGASASQTGGLNFIAPVNCLLPDIMDNIHDIRDVANLNYTGGITIIASTSTLDSNIEVYENNVLVTKPASKVVAGTTEWKTITISGLDGDVRVQSTGPIAVGFFGVSGNAGVAGYFSGFDTVPIVEISVTGGGCLPGAEIKEVTGGFEYYEWFQNGVSVSEGVTQSSYTPTEAGDFYVKVTKGGCSYDSAILSVYNCDPEIVLTKTVDATPVLEGDTVTFTVTVESLGENLVTGLVINDALPPELSFVSAAPNYGSWSAPNWTIGNMSSGEIHQIDIVATVNEVTATTTVTNTISNTQNEVEGDVIPDDDTEQVTIINSEIELTKTDRAPLDGSFDTVGEVITYDFVVTNTGDTALTNITITDSKIDSGSLSPSSVANLAIGASANFTATHTITQADIEADQVVNSATAQATLSNGFVISDISDDPDNSNNTIDDPTITPIDQKGGILVEKIAQPAPDGLYDTAGEIITYEITVFNTGNVSLNNVTVTDPMADSGSISPASIANLPVGESAVFSAQHTIVLNDFNTGSVINTATATGTEIVEGTTVMDQSDDPTTATPNDATVVSVPQYGQLQVTKVDAPAIDGAFDTVGEEIIYTVIATSVGNVTLTDVNIVDPNADVIELTSTTGTDTDNSDGRVESLNPNETATFTIKHFLTQEDLDKGEVVNTATVGSLDPGMGSVTDLSDDPDDPTTTDDIPNKVTAADPTITPLISTPSLSVTKVVDDYFHVAEGQTITYTYVVTNDNNVTINNVSINDAHIANGTLSTPELQSTTGTDADNSDNQIDILAPGETGTWTATYLVTAIDISNQANITNTVTATGTPSTESFIDPTANVLVTVHPIEVICSGETLNHDLTGDNTFTGATYSWFATDNANVSGETTSASTSTSIADTLLNESGIDQIVEYTITVTVSGVVKDVYKYKVTVHSQLVVPENDVDTVNCLAEAIQPLTPVVNDFNGTAITPVITENTDPVCEGDKVYTFTYTDPNCAGNVSVYTYTYTLDVTTLPVVPANGSSTVECLADATQPTAPVVKDVCGNDITPVITENTDPLCEGNKVYTFTYTDCAGNVSVYTYTYTLDVTTLPVVPANASSTVECLADATQPTAPEVKDVCGNPITPIITENTDPVCEGDKIYTFTYTDCAGNSSVYTYTYTLDVTTLPVVPANASSTVECLADATQPTAPEVKDVCGNTITPIITENTDPLCEGDKIYTFTYTDCAGNVSVYTYTYTLDVTTLPVVPANASSTVECLADATQPTAPVVKDVCGNDITPIITENTDPICEGDKIYTFTYTDCAGNVSVYTYTYTLDVTTLPVVPANASSTVECLADATQPTAPEVKDVCGNTITPIITENMDPLCEGDKIYTFTYTDCAGNVSVYTYTYTLDVTTLPVVPANGSSTVECLADATQPTAPEVKDVCGNPITPIITENTDPVCEGDKIYTFTYTDCAGNSSVYTYTYTLDVTTLPVVPANGSSTVECLADATQPTAPVVKDVCGNPITPIITENTDPLCEGDKIYTFTYTDCAGNSSVYTYTYTLDVTTLPVVPANASSTVECLADATQPTAPVVKDVCGNDITAIITENTDPLCEGDKIYTFTYTDCAGNVSVYTYTYTLDVTTLPVVPSNASSTVECLADATQPTAPVVKDVCGNDITAIITENTDPLCEGDKIYTFTYTDCAGNVSVYTYTYTLDVTTLPVVPANGSSTVECLADATQPTAPVVKDVCGNTITPIITENTDPLCEGDKIYTFTYTDCAGNVSVYTYTYTLDVTTLPVVPANASSTVECLADATQPTAPEVKDVCGNDITPIITENTDPLCEGDKIYTFTYTDCAGNVSVYTYTYTLDVTTLPVVPANGSSTVECLADATQPTAPVVKDVCGNPITPIITENTDPVCEGDKIYTFTYTDCAGNVSVYTYTYTLDVTTLPVVPANGSSTVECLADATQPTAPEVKDVCGNDITPVITENMDPLCEGDKIYTFTYTDCAGNSSVYTYTYTLDVTTLPVVPANASSTVECLADATQPTAPEVKDVCGNDITPVITENTDPVCEGNKVYTFTYTDCAGNVSVYTYTYTLDVTTLPVVPANGSSTVECLADATQPTAPEVKDVCGNPITPIITENMDPLCEGDKIYTFTYTDCAGNVSVYTYTYTLDVTTLPVVPANGSSTVECLADATQPTAPVV